MRVPVDLHEDDLASRIALAGQLRGARAARGFSAADLAETLGVTAAAVYAFERRTSWEAATVMRYARATGGRVTFHLEGLELPDDGDIMSLIYGAVSAATSSQEDQAHWRQVCSDLRRIRRATHTAIGFAKILGVNENAVHYWEANPDGSSIIAAQRHARGLGGRLLWRLHETVAAVPAPRRTA
jgi:DNA-binding transcriptional regulator YiaG